MAKCEYGRSCPIEPLIGDRVALESELDLVERLTNPENEKEVAAKARRIEGIQRKIAQVNTRLSDYPPCKFCVYQ